MDKAVRQRDREQHPLDRASVHELPVVWGGVALDAAARAANDRGPHFEHVHKSPSFCEIPQIIDPLRGEHLWVEPVGHSAQAARERHEDHDVASSPGALVCCCCSATTLVKTPIDW